MPHLNTINLQKEVYYIIMQKIKKWRIIDMALSPIDRNTSVKVFERLSKYIELKIEKARLSKVD